MLERQSDLRCLPVRLCDIRPDVRIAAARKVGTAEPRWAPGVLHAALFPSRTVYWVEAEALPLLLQVAA